MSFIDLHTHQIPLEGESFPILNWSFNDDLEENVSYSIGIHPWTTKVIKESHLKAIEKYVSLNEVIAIGECGLDKLIGANLERQMEIFKFHIQLSESYQKPLIIHCVKAYSEIIKLRKDSKPTQPWIFHAFNSSIESMQQANEAGFYFSFGGLSLNPESKSHLALMHVPEEKLFLETDNKALQIKELYMQVAGLRFNDKLDELKEQILNNFETVFGFRPDNKH